MKLGDVITLRKGNTIEIQDAETYRISGIQNYGKGVVIRRQVKGSELTMREYQVIEANQLMWCKVDTKNGAFGVTHPEHVGTLASPNMALADIDPKKADAVFLETLFRIPSFADYITNLSTGTTNRKYLTPKELLRQVTLPDWSTEQQRQFVDKLKKIEACGLPAELAHQEDLVAKLKQAILQEAITGRLTAGWRAAQTEVEPASQLLARIRAEKARLVAAKKLRAEKPVSPISESEIPFAISKGWEWCRLGDVYPSTSGGTPARTHPSYWNGKIRWLKSGEMNDGYITEQPEECITEVGLENSAASLFPEGTLLIAMYGATAGKLGILTYPSTTNQAVCGLFTHALAETRYVFYYLLSQRARMLQDSWGNSQPNISQGYIRNLPIPLPPLREQTEIVARVERLMERSRELEAEIARSRAHAAALLQAVLREAFAPATSEAA
jgi:type I restriction enzyme S subunit